MPRLTIEHPPWLEAVADFGPPFATLEERMQLVIALSRENMRQETGGPFAAAVFESESGRLVSVGVNSVIRLRNSVLHAETMALMMAQQTLGSYTLDAPECGPYELVVSCDPCAMCLGAVLWSGVRKVVCAASRDDAMAIGFEEGPVFPQSFTYLKKRGIEIQRGFLRREAKAVLDEYAETGGAIYNA
jgi:tRNA(Arg) A34 adenosine deaminase TadA